MSRPTPSPARSSRSAAKGAAQGAADPSRLWQSIGAGSVAVLFLSRFFLPAESAYLGDTLWIVGLWLLCGVAWMAGVWRGRLSPVRLDGVDAAAALWIAGQVVSAAAVILTAGQKRSAANLGWEWIGIAAIWLVVRHGIVDRSLRSALLRVTIVTGVVLAGYGLYQHYVSHPRLAAEYGPLFDRLRTASGGEAATIRQQLSRAGIPTEGPALVLFEKRLRDSQEPLGLYALANTFGGILAVCLLLGLAEVIELCRRRIRWTALIPLAAGVGMMAWCLMLTKSRTAWIGAACGLGVLAAANVKVAFSRRVLLLSGLSLSAIVVMTVLVLALGGLDRQVLTEAPKSLAYRLQYWQATTRLIADHPWLGVGPGNFRQHYLQYKLPEASEEISDPHNLFFETAATGGIVSAIGLALFIGLAVFRAWRSAAADGRTATGSLSTAPDRSGWVFRPATCSGGGALLAFAGSLACFGDWEDRLLVLAVAWAGAAWIVGRSRSVAEGNSRFVPQPVAALAAGVALVTHLLGAGGIGMAGVAQVLVVLLAISLPPTDENLQEPRSWTPRPLWLGAGFGLALIGLTLALMTVLESRRLIKQGMVASWSAGAQGRAIAREYYRQAAQADPWSPDPWQNQFEWWVAGGIESNDSFQSAVDQLHEVQVRDPENYWAPRTLGNVWLQRSRVTRQRQDADQAAQWLRRALKHYPTNSAIRAELALALDLAGERADAAAMARSALEQDDMNHRQGHIDRYLDEVIQAQMQALAGPPP